MGRLVTRLWVAGGLALLAAALAVVAAGATGRDGLDKAYGDRGVVEVPSPFPHADAGWTSVSSFAAARDGTAYALGDAVACELQSCPVREFLLRFRPDGRRDGSFGGGGTVFVPVAAKYPTVTVIADGAGRAVVGETHKWKIVLRRFEPSGERDGSFGQAGVVKLRSPWAEVEPEFLALPGGRLMVVVSHGVSSAKRSYDKVATQVRLTELRSDGTKDKGFGRSGTSAFTIPRKGDLGATARAADGSILFGGVSWGEAPPKAWLWRVTAAGKVDRRFDRNALRSLRRLGRLGEFPGLVSIVPRVDGSLAALGTIHEHLGFDLHLRRDGRLAAGFARHGLVTFAVTVEDAVGGINSSVFFVGEGKHRLYHSAYRVLADGRLDPAYRGAAGIKVPLPGEGIGVQSLSRGRALVTNLGYYECRQGCPPEPGMARFLE